jgi:hypothetical protein
MCGKALWYLFAVIIGKRRKGEPRRPRNASVRAIIELYRNLCHALMGIEDVLKALGD